MKKELKNVRSVSPAYVLKKQSAPLFSSQPAAGFPAPGDDLIEKPLDLNDLLIDNPTATFFVRVSGDSMEGAGIFNGDILVVDRSVPAIDGSIVVAAVFGELVVKRLKKYSQKAELISENEAYSPITINDVDDVYIWGVVVGSARIFK
ncbi:MAG: translesion error-prone DNA polymerase V autoproteolytic subunit [Candidatus Pacebacteria bacterium]|nr:translesion error-prone DNA polymerase V autoproteolytic subunit [Candidatus Paceibacterota bacterium]MBP9843277.1 translesion error-prone DNA polymerase V autoproteolytic subunit [Candidatus Paceibacterota bacterium]